MPKPNSKWEWTHPNEKTKKKKCFGYNNSMGERIEFDGKKEVKMLDILTYLNDTSTYRRNTALIRPHSLSLSKSIFSPFLSFPLWHFILTNLINPIFLSSAEYGNV